MYGGNPAGLLEFSGLQYRRVSGETDVWAVQTEESYYRRPSRLVTLEHLIGPAVYGEHFDALNKLIDPAPTTLSNEAILKINQLGKQAEESGNITDMIAHMQVILMAVPVTELAATAREMYSVISGLPVKDAPMERPLGDASMHLVRRDSLLTHRIKFAAIWMQLENDERLREQGPQFLRRQLSGEERVFQSSSELHSGIYIFDAYMGPLLGSLSPYVWGFYTGHTFGNIVATYGLPLSGVRSGAAELLQTISIQGGTSAVPRSPVKPRSATIAVEWWVTAMNDLFAVLSDFANFIDKDGFYDSARHLHTMLTVEQLFRRMVSMQVEHRDLHARRVLLFSALDTLQRLARRPIETHCSLRVARKTLNKLREKIPRDAADILIPRAVEAVEALEQMQSGFFLSKSSGVVKVADEKRGERILNLDTAVAHYIKVLRDATHGHGSNRDGSIAKTNALLAHHNGEVPHALGWIAYLYLLDFLANPETFKSIIRSQYS
ncbi:hypothetical protein EV650_5428 [Kribbella kalugense]|uniref:Uncharacterized protein n=2 Tax=Kribbella kalugense TaxID=2512221 RepID=A0A4R7ZMN0_9ACTN|nr:hypothetical protein EV650_5428 [Kribbella kalugense]